MSFLSNLFASSKPTSLDAEAALARLHAAHRDAVSDIAKAEATLACSTFVLMGRLKGTLGEAPPTVGSARRLGAIALVVSCNAPCRRRARVRLDALRLPDETPFADISARRRLICEACGRRAGSIEVDWDAEQPEAGRV